MSELQVQQCSGQVMSGHPGLQLFKMFVRLPLLLHFHELCCNPQEQAASLQQHHQAHNAASGPKLSSLRK